MEFKIGGKITLADNKDFYILEIIKVSYLYIF